MLLVRGALVVTMDPGRTIMRNGAVLVDGDRIRAVGPAAELARHAGITRVIGDDRGLVMPGLVNAHNHCFQTLYRGLGDGHALAEWSARTVYPLSRGLTRTEAAAGAALACLEMALGGTTSFVDSHYIHVDPMTFDGVAEAVVASGLRALLGRAAVDGPAVPEPFREEPALAERRAEHAIERWHGAAGGRVRVRPEALSERTASPAMVKAMAAVGRRTGTGFNMHLAESRQGVQHVRETHGVSSARLLERLDALGPDVLLAHGVWLDDGDIALLARSRTAVSHNPVSNQYLAVGVAPVPALLANGVAVGLGTDGAVSNDNLDMFAVMKACGLLQKVTTGNAAAVPAERIVAMATIDAARATGLGDEIGSLEPGKKADVIALSTDRPDMTPLHRAYESLVYAASPAAVDTVIVDGRIVVHEGRIQTLDDRSVLAEARAAAQRLATRAGVPSLTA
ncbi:MAG: amidohydrolase [Candidatus Rokubacteria bacterium]|nr:amidohydrolase [Candidatus Rokubacteria bacterium]